MGGFFFLPRLHADLMCCSVTAHSPSGMSGASVALLRGRRVRANPGDISTPGDICPIGPSHAEPRHIFQKQFSLMFHFVRVCLLCPRVCLLSVWLVEACGEAQYAVSVLTAPGSIGAVSD